MSEQAGGELWPHFVPLWNDLRNISPGIKLAGGYGMFLKQQWLFSTTGDRLPILVPTHLWREHRPRVTKDIDLIVDVDLIASRDDQEDLQRVLEARGFEVVPGNARWQFEKRLDSERSVVLDFHAPPPGPGRKGVRAQSRRVKPRPTLGQMGIHGRANAQVVCSDLHPFIFVLQDETIALPNAVTLAFTKIAAARDQRRESQNPDNTRGQRATAEGQAGKHAADLFRMVAMLTREESDCIPDILDAARPSGAFAEAQAAFYNLFDRPDSWGSRVAGAHWGRKENELIRSALQGWFA